MKKSRSIRRTVSVCMAAVLLAVCVTSCGGSGQGNTSPEEEKEVTEADLTAVREELIKTSETEGLGEITAMEFYENGVRSASSQYVQAKDNKKMYYSGDIKRVVNYPDGYILDIPQDWAPDYSMSTVRVRYTTDQVTLIATNEDEIYDNYTSAQDYIESIFQYITAETYMKVNRVKKLSEETLELQDGYKAYVLKMHLLDCEETIKSYYTYVVYYNGTNRCVQLMFKAVDDRDFASVYNTFRPISVKGIALDTLTYPCEDKASWNEETRAYYNSLKNADKISWGIFADNIDTGTLDSKIPGIEEKIDYTFPLISSYTEMDWSFPLKYAKKLTEDGHILQYTHHFSRWTSEVGMGKEAPILDVYRGKKDGDLTRVAKQLAHYGETTLFRLNNEMNSDWTCWSAVNAMLDPEIFTDTWIRMYNIFEEAGANANCIWVWNPQADYSIPKANWNEVRTYMPGPEYVDMIGVTYYNFGNDKTWASFDDLYYGIDEYYGKYFRDWPWIIGEFGCSDTQGPARKAQWITDMFDSFAAGKYPNIKAAIWFSCNDYDSAGNITHLLLLEESDETLNAFKEGLAKTQ